MTSNYLFGPAQIEKRMIRKKARVKVSRKILARLIPLKCICFNGTVSRTIINGTTKSLPIVKEWGECFGVIVFLILALFAVLAASCVDA